MSIWSNSGWRVVPVEPADACKRCPEMKNVQQKIALLNQIQEKMKHEQVKLNQREEELNRWRRTLKDQSDRLNKMQSRLQARERALAGKEAENAQKSQMLPASVLEEMLSRQKAAILKELEAREQELARREKEQNAREAELNQRQAAVQAGIERYQQERQQWMQMQPASGKADASEELRGVKKAFMDINPELKLIREQLVQLGDRLERDSRQGVLLLCRLYRDMAFSEDRQMHAKADQLSVILQCEFDAQVVEPCPGELFDSTCHERMDLSRGGERVMCCLARGWRWKDEILMRAVVDTEERKENE